MADSTNYTVKNVCDYTRDLRGRYGKLCRKHPRKSAFIISTENFPYLLRCPLGFRAGRAPGGHPWTRRRTARVVARRGGRPVFNSWSLLPMLPPPDWCALDELCECLYTGSPCMRCEYLDRSCGGRHTLYLDRADSQLDGHMSVLYAGRQLFVFALMRSLHAPLNVYIKSHFTKFYANTWLTHYRFTWVIQKFVKHCTLKSYLIMPLRRIPAYWYCIFLTNGIHKCAPYNRL